MARKDEGLTAGLGLRVQPDEAHMMKDIAGGLGLSQNRAARWMIRFAWQHVTSVVDHTECPQESPCRLAAADVRAARTDLAAG